MGRQTGGNGNGRIRVIDGNRGDFSDVVRARIPTLPGGRGILGYFLAGFAAVLLVAIFNLPTLAANVHVNIWWFESIRLGDVYGRIWDVQRNLFLVFFFISYVFLTIIFFATRLLTFRPGPDPVARWTGAALSLVTGFVVASAAMIIGHVM